VPLSATRPSTCCQEDCTKGEPWCGESVRALPHLGQMLGRKETTGCFFFLILGFLRLYSLGLAALDIDDSFVSVMISL